MEPAHGKRLLVRLLLLAAGEVCGSKRSPVEGTLYFCDSMYLVHFGPCFGSQLSEASDLDLNSWRMDIKASLYRTHLAVQLLLEAMYTYRHVGTHRYVDIDIDIAIYICKHIHMYIYIYMYILHIYIYTYETDPNSQSRAASHCSVHPPRRDPSGIRPAFYYADEDARLFLQGLAPWSTGCTYYCMYICMYT